MYSMDSTISALYPPRRSHRSMSAILRVGLPLSGSFTRSGPRRRKSSRTSSTIPELTGDSGITMRLLVVEDEPEMAELLRKGLEEENHRVIVARDGRAAFELAKA